MLFLLFITTILSQSPIWQCDFENPLENCFTARNTTVSHSCKIVPCTNVKTINHCLQVRKRSFDGDCFSQEINHNVSHSDPNDVIIVEFQYMPVRHPFNQIYSSGLFFGYEEVSGKYEPIHWVALSKTPEPLSNSIITNYSFELIDVKNEWTYARLNIHPEKEKTIRLVIEDFIDSRGVSGDFLLDNITVYHKQLCSQNCKVCKSFKTCLACDESFYLYKDQCFSKTCLDNISQLKQENILLYYKKENQLFILDFQGAILSCYDFNLIVQGKQIMFNRWQNGINFTFNSSLMEQLKCKFTRIEWFAYYACDFYLSILLKSSTAIISNVQWKSTFKFNLNDVAFVQSADVSGLTKQIDNITEVIVTVKGEAKVCSDQDCNQFMELPVLTIGEFFPLYFSIEESGYQEQYYPNITQVYVMGNGTLIKLDIYYDKVKNTTNGVIYQMIIPMVVQDGYLAITAQLFSKVQERILQSEKRQLTVAEYQTKYQIASKIQFKAKVQEKVKVPGYVPYVIFGTVVGLTCLMLMINLIKKHFSNSEEKSLEKIKLTL